MKRLGTIVLSILVLYAGVAWALEKCWAREGHADYVASETHHDSHSSLRHSHPSGDSFSLIHCCSFANGVGPATKTAVTRLPRPIEEISLDRYRSVLPVSVGLSGSGLLISLRRNLTFSFHAGIPHHLFLSVLHIWISDWSLWFLFLGLSSWCSWGEDQLS